MNKIDISDTLIERPVSFCYKHKRYSLYPLSLGKIQLCSRLIEALGFDKVSTDKDLYRLALKAAKNDQEKSIRLISYLTLPGNLCLNESEVQGRIKKFSRIKEKDLASLLVLFLTQDKTEAIMREFKIDDESKRLSEVLKVKAESKENGSLSFGGKSIWGTLIDSACERYGWTYQYVLWGISFSALQLLLSDHIKTIFLTEEERKRAPRLATNTIINASDSKALNEFIELQSWK